jgi:hypothetical protein
VTVKRAEWLLISYREPGGGTRPLGVVLYVFDTDEIYIRFRDEFPFVDGDDHEILSGTSQHVRSIALDVGARAAFQWMSDTLSNTIFVEGPYAVSTVNPDETLSHLFNGTCGAAT